MVAIHPLCFVMSLAAEVGRVGLMLVIHAFARPAPQARPPRILLLPFIHSTALKCT